MLKEEKVSRLRDILRRDLRQIFINAHADVDAEFIRMAVETGNLRKKAGAENIRLLRRKRQYTILLDIEVVDIILALARMDDGTYGLCEQCRSVIPLHVLEQTPTELFCHCCRVAAKLQARN